jgi:hypothetical protein
VPGPRSDRRGAAHDGGRTAGGQEAGAGGGRAPQRQASGWHLERRVCVFHKQKLALRLLAVRVPPELAEQRRQRVRREAKERGRPVSQKKRELISASEGWEVRRVRWRIELVFRVFKSLGGLEKTQARTRERVLSELYAKLLAMAILRVRNALDQSGLPGQNVELFMAACDRTDHGVSDLDAMTRQGWWHGKLYLGFDQALAEGQAHPHPENTRVLRFQTAAPDTIDFIELNPQ